MRKDLILILGLSFFSVLCRASTISGQTLQRSSLLKTKMSVNASSLIETVRDNMSQPVFGWMNYMFFATMLSVSAGIGMYFGFFTKKQETTTDYLLGGKTMSYFPVAISITASHLSGITLLGVPTESYEFGSQYAACIVTATLTGIMTSYVFLPVFYKLQLTSTFEYLEIRFARSVRLFASGLSTISMILHAPIAIYGPALAFSLVTGFDLHYIALVMCAICIFYTSVGGLKAVVWTDTIQSTVTICTLFIVLALGIISVGGLGEVWRISGEGGRLVFFNMDPSPFARTSFWGIAIGLTTNWVGGISINQSAMQRFLAVPTISNARVSIFIMCIALIIGKCLSVYTGLVIYAKYHDCDPISTHKVKRPDQILPYYMMDVAGNIPALPGLFLAALVNAALSAMSGGLNTVAGTIWEDFISPFIPESDTKQKTATNVMKVTVVVLGCICAALVFAVEHMGEIFSMATSMHGITSGTMIGLYTLGMLVPWANEKGAVIGGIAAFAASTWIIVGAQIHKLNGTIRDVPLPISTENCSYPLNMTHWTKPTPPQIEPEDEPMILFTISFLYYNVVGVVTLLTVGTVASFLTGPSDLKQLNRDLFSPIVQRFLPREKYAEVPISEIPTSQSDKKKQGM